MTRHLFVEIGKGKFFFLWGLSLLFGISERMGEATSVSLHCLTILNDQYYFIFGILPTFLAICASVMEDDGALVLLRHGTYGKYFFTKWQALAAVSTFLWLGQILLISISGLGLSFNGGWYGGTWQADSSVFNLLQTYFATPTEAIVSSAVYLLLGYWMTGLTALWLGHFCRRSLAVKLLMGLYVLAVAYVKLPIMSHKPFVFFTGLNHWILLLHNLTETWRPGLTAGTTLILIIFMAWSVRRNWRGQLNIPNKMHTGLAPYYRRILFTRHNVFLLAGGILLLAAWSWVRSGAPEDGTDWLLRLFAGHGTGYFYAMGLLYLLVLDILPIWAICVFWEQASGERSAFLTVRLTRRVQLTQAMLFTAFLWILMYGCFLTIVAVLPPTILALPIDGEITLAAVGLKLLDVWGQILFVLTIFCLTGQTAIGFIAVVLMHFLCILPISWLPVGLSSLTRLALPQTGGAIPLHSASFLLLALVCILSMWIYIWGIKKLFSFNH